MAILVFCPAHSVSQTTEIRGDVKDATGAPIPKASIYIRGWTKDPTTGVPSLTAPKSIEADSEGTFEILLPEGKYNLLAQSYAFRPETLAFRVISGRANNIHIVMKLESSGSLSVEESRQYLRSELLNLAGASAHSCGQVQSHKPAPPDLRSEETCIQRSIKAGFSFWVYYERPGVDSVVLRGFAGNARGQVFQVDFDSYGFASEGLGGRPNNKALTATAECSLPIRIQKSGTGDLECKHR